MSKKQARVPGTLTRGKPRKPGWRVMLVGFGVCAFPGCTEDHGLEDPADAFGYTVGLHQRHRLPELRLAAAPENGDAGPLSYVIAGEILNRLADGVVARTYNAGETVAIGGVPHLGTVVCSLGDPVAPDDVDAFQAHPDAEVIPVTWTTAKHTRAITFGANGGGAIVRISHSRKRIDSNDSGFVLEYEHFRMPDVAAGDSLGVICTGCLIEEYPEAGRGLDLAREYGLAELVDGEWVGVPPHPGWRRLEDAVTRVRQIEETPAA